MSVLFVENLTVTSGDVRLLNEVSFSLEPGQIMAVIGPNGAGKSTLIRALSSEIKPAAGRIEFAGIGLDQWHPKARARQLAILPQQSTLSFPYTVEEVVLLGRLPHVTGVLADKNMVRDAMQALDIHHLAARFYTQLSGGEKQRTQLARVLVQIWSSAGVGARLLILDEPSGALDLGHKQQLMRVVSEFARTGVAVLMAEHDINLAVNYAHRVLALKNGATVACGPTDKAVDAKVISELFDAPVSSVQHPQTRKPVFLS